MPEERTTPEDLHACRKLLAALEGLPEVVEATSYDYPAFKVGRSGLPSRSWHQRTVDHGMSSGCLPGRLL